MPTHFATNIDAHSFGEKPVVKITLFLKIYGPLSLSALVSFAFRLQVTSSRIIDSDLLVFSSGDEMSAVPTPRRVEHDVGWVNHHKDLSDAHIPDYDFVIRSSAK